MITTVSSTLRAFSRRAVAAAAALAIATGAALPAHAAWNDTLTDGTVLTAQRWNDLVTAVASRISIPGVCTNGQALTYNGSTFVCSDISVSSHTHTGVVQGNTQVNATDSGSNGTVTVQTEGAERVRVDSVGNVGIGTSSPAVALHLGSGVSGGQPTLLLTNTNTQTGQLSRWANRLELMATDAVALAVGTTGNIVMWIAGNGNVGIGTQTPGARLEVAGNIIASEPTAANHVATKNYVDTKAISAHTHTGIVNGTSSLAIGSSGGTISATVGGAEQFRIGSTTSAVNYVQANGSTTGNTPYLTGQGADANVGLNLITKGTGNVGFYTNGGTPQLLIPHTASAVNYFTATGATTGNRPYFSVGGTDANIGTTFATKGTGSHVFNTNSNDVQAMISHTANAVNYTQITGAATGVNPTLSAQGADTNIGFNFNAKNAGGFAFNATGTQFSVAPTASSVNYLRVTGAATGAAPALSAQGTDTNIDLTLTPKGAAGLLLSQTTAPSTTANKLYNVGGNLFWNGNAINSGGTMADGTAAAPGLKFANDPDTGVFAPTSGGNLLGISTLGIERLRIGSMLDAIPGLASNTNTLNSTGVLANNGNLRLQAAAGSTNAANTTTGGAVQVVAGSSESGTARGGGAVTISAGAGDPSGAFNGGNANVSAGVGGTTGNGGSVSISAGRAGWNGTDYAGSTGSGGAVGITAGQAGLAGGTGGAVNITAGQGNAGAGGTVQVSGGFGTTNPGGPAYLSGGTGASGGVAAINGGTGTAGNGGDTSIDGGSSNTAAGGNASVRAGSGPTGGGYVGIVGGNATSGGAGGQVAIESGWGRGSGVGGSATLASGAGGVTGNAGAVNINGGRTGWNGTGWDASGTGNGGDVNLNGGLAGLANGRGGSINMVTGGNSATYSGEAAGFYFKSTDTTLGDGGKYQVLAGSSVNSNGGPVQVVAGASTSGTGGSATLQAGNSTNGVGGNTAIRSGASTNLDAGTLYLIGQNGGRNGGTVQISTGDGGTGTAGALNINTGSTSSASQYGGFVDFVAGTSPNRNRNGNITFRSMGEYGLSDVGFWMALASNVMPGGAIGTALLVPHQRGIVLRSAAEANKGGLWLYGGQDDGGNSSGASNAGIGAGSMGDTMTMRPLASAASNIFFNNGGIYLTTDTGLTANINNTFAPTVRLAVNPEGSLTINNISAPGTTTNKLYSVSGNLFWNGTQLGSGGSSNAITNGTSNMTIGSSGGTISATVGGAEQFRIGSTASAVNYLQAQGGATGGSPLLTTQGSDTNIGLGITTKGTGSVSVGTAGGAVVNFSHTASAVNYHELTGSTTGNAPIWRAQGTDANVGLQVTTKGTGSFDINTGGGKQLRVNNQASAVNYLTLTGGATSVQPAISVEGSDANIGLKMITKGTGGVLFQTNSSANQFNIAHTASAVNYLQATGAATTGTPSLSAQGTDTNIDLTLTPKGAAGIQISQTTAPSTTTNKLYNVSGNLFWNGTQLGGTPTGISNSNSYVNIGSAGGDVSIARGGSLRLVVDSSGAVVTGRSQASVYSDTMTSQTNVSGSANLADPTTNGSLQRVTLTGNTTLTLPNPTTASNEALTMTVLVQQDGTGSRTLSWSGGSNTLTWSGGSAPSVCTAASSRTVYAFTKIGSEWLGSAAWQSC